MVKYYLMFVDEYLFFALTNAGATQSSQVDQTSVVDGADMNAREQFNLAFKYVYGKGVKQNFKRAVELFTLAADKGLYTNAVGQQWWNRVLL